MNSKKHTLSRKLLATLLTATMLITMFPANVFAGEPGSGEPTTSVTSESNGVTVNKYVSGDSESGYNLTLEAYASNQLTTTTTTTPLDITLVLDVSGSMDDHFIDGYTEYTPVYELDQSESYFVKIGDSYRSVSYYEGGRFVQKGWSYWQGWKQYVVQPMTSAEDFEQSHIQFYEAAYVQGQSKMDALKSAVNTFINQVNEKNTAISDNSQKHRISLVKFADNSYANSIGNDKISDYSDYNFTQVVSDFSTNASDLTSKVTALDAGGATAAEYGLTLAQEVINGQSNNVSNLQGARENAKKIVIFFTDGSPNHSNGFSESVVNSAIGKAKELKDNNVDVYSVGVFEDVNSVINGYMNGISSNYPNATAYNSLGDQAADKYYSTADSPDALLKVFEGIAEEITTGTLTANPDSTAVLSDTLSQYFNLPDNFSDTGVTVKYAPATDYDPETKTFTFGEVQDLPESVSLSVNVDNENETITVSGFDYKKYAASYNSSKKEVSGGKLVVTFPIEIDEAACNADQTITNNMYPTNDTSANVGLYYKSENASQNDIWTTLNDSPKVPYTKQAFTVSYRLTSTENPSDAGTAPAGGEYTQNETVPVASALTTTETTKDRVPGTWTFSGWTTKDATVKDGSFTMPGKNVEFTGSWTFTADTFDLTYNVNGGKFGDSSNQTAEVKNLEAKDYNLWTKGEEGQSDSGTKPENMTFPTHDSVEKDGKQVAVAFIGWTTDDQAVGKYYEAGQEYPAISKTLTLNSDTIVYAVWGYDTNGDDIADATQVMIQPAAMTIYTGGDGYLGTVDDASGTTVGTKESGLPEPGFYFTLPYDMNQAIKAAAGTSGNAADLSQYLTIGAKADSGTGTKEDRSWTIQLYDPDGTSDVNGKYVYSFTPGKGQEKVRMQFTNGEDIIISDKFNVKDALHQEYTMSLYTGSVDAKTVQAVVKAGQANLTATVGLLDSTLTIRGTTGQNTSTEDVVAQVPETINTITAVEGSKKPTYYINGSKIQVSDQNVQLLVDSIVDSELGEGQYVHDTLLDMAKDENALPSSYDGVEFKYLDLVDRSNGNVWVTMGDDDSLTVYWPYPEGTDQDDDFTIIHYEGLDREFDLNNLANQEVDIQKITPEKTAQGLKFTVSSFSPFALVYDKQTSGGGGTTGGGTTPNPPALNTEDHFSYVVGYEDGMVKPENAITRAEVASIFYRLLKDDVRDANTTDVSEFSDVSASDWYGTTVATLSAMDIVRGYEDGTFRPNAPITRAEFAAIATRFFEETGAEYEPGTFDDVTGDEWFANAIADAVELGLIGGYPDGTVRPNNNITRAEACAIVNRTLGRIPHVDHLLPADEMTTWPDNNPSDWFYADMQEATNGHEYEWTTEQGQKVEEWTEILDKDWEDR